MNDDDVCKNTSCSILSREVEGLMKGASVHVEGLKDVKVDDDWIQLERKEGGILFVRFDEVNGWMIKDGNEEIAVENLHGWLMDWSALYKKSFIDTLRRKLLNLK